MVLMKLSKLHVLFLVLISFFLLNTCDTLTEKNDECEKTKWAAVREPVIDLYIAVPSTNCDKVNRTNLTDSAGQMICSGSITKIYCDGTVSGSFSFNTTFYPLQMNDEELSKQQVGQAYQFKFQNDKDYLVFIGRLKAYFPGGITWESEEINFKIYYKNILTDPYNYNNYCHVVINEAILWYRVI
jgi:hypothetical protein